MRSVVSALEDLPSVEGLEPQDVFICLNDFEQAGGAQRFGHTLAQGLAVRGHRVELIGIRHHPERGPQFVSDPLYSEFVLCDTPDQAAELADYAGGRTLSERERARVHDLNVGRLRERMARASDPFIVAVQVWTMNWLEAAAPGHGRVIGMSHESVRASRASGRYGRLKRFYHDVHTLLVLTDEDALELERVGFNNVMVMPNPAALDPAPRSDLDDDLVVYLGRLSEEKRPDRLLDAFVAVGDAHPTWRLEFWGDGPLRQELSQRIERSGMGARVALRGVSHDVREVLARASILGLSSDHEGLPLVLVEAMSCGVPCVAVDCSPGIRSIVTNGRDGLVTPRASVEGLATGLSTLMGDRTYLRTLGAAARDSAKRFAPSRVFSGWEDLMAFSQR